NISKDSDSATISVPKSDLKQKLDFYHKKAAVPNIVKAIQNWVKKLDEFYPSLIEQQVCEFIAQMTKKDGGEYKAKTVKQAINRINRYISKISNTLGPTSDFTKYISKCLSDTSNNFYLQPNQNWYETSIWYLKTHCGLNRVGNFIKDIKQKVKVIHLNSALTNYSKRKTAVQILQDANIPEDVIMNIIGHKSSQSVHAYKTVSKSQKINTMKTLINTIKPASNINPINQEFSI
ncbi:29271_t:CDS:2, partial [Gigaspora margarita]